MSDLVLEILAGWTALAVVLGVFVGRFLAGARVVAETHCRRNVPDASRVWSVEKDKSSALR